MSKTFGFSSAAAIAVLACAFVATPAMAKSAKTPMAHKTPTAQRTRMGTCNKEAKGKHGADRKTFMSHCLSTHHASKGHMLSASQQRMKTCNADAKAKVLKGPARKSFMSSCLKKH